MGSTADSAYTALVNKAVKGSGCSAAVYVKPGSAAGSLFYLKMTAGANVGGGDYMPPSDGPLSAQLSDLVKSWIAGGALK